MIRIVLIQLSLHRAAAYCRLSLRESSVSELYFRGAQGDSKKCQPRSQTDLLKVQYSLAVEKILQLCGRHTHLLRICQNFPVAPPLEAERKSR